MQPLGEVRFVTQSQHPLGAGPGFGTLGTKAESGKAELAMKGLQSI